ncbi:MULTISPECIES: DUF3558 domain-containing protein [Streptomyces]|uniref:DUF3558 domain-containing protein n=1 Tax=Streptomyces venezuelae (strain ATCC 10712 / CBS 650.69 / DSM 40230 / JCM 4526 / NBRC 13096 / PD 04745) TaxID=953739 RepID=F2R8Z9_STRVP|nr:DUF3558 domain-containing protein [Streptomyces venezuelae]APE22301.1 DUF3558 domain-containing protein [Streptomyces venezuelae]QER99683.1 DUF3558 domain-containing protein [Streptomyces venezuelae ATCC 10712]QES06702.1 DUF3558 domain-containing protein [Streptomyces venezuelae]QES14554.1 DUF3558 domain-containing protein [Streptomyces venezuelae]CCA56459.1 hypothetical protein SVEN_3173 [Streptomyces venezuelae ATCC 10712]
MQRTAPRLTRILACAAVPVMLVVAGCSSDSGDSGSGATGSKDKASASASATPSPSATTKKVEPAKFAKLPEACKAITAKETGALVPKAKNKNGTPAPSTDPASRGGCSWNGLDDKGVKGSQYRWLDVSFYRYDSDAALGSGQERAQENFAKELAKIEQTPGAKQPVTKSVSGVGDEAKTVAYQLRKTDEDFVYGSVVARTGNVLVLLSYNGAGYAGAETPSAKNVMDGALTAAKEAVAAVAAANK